VSESDGSLHRGSLHRGSITQGSITQEGKPGPKGGRQDWRIASWERTKDVHVLRRGASSIDVEHSCKLERSLWGRDVWFVTEVIYSTRHLPFLVEFDLWTAYLVEPPRAFFSSGDYSIALSNDFDTVWPSRDFCQNLQVFSDGLFLLGPYSPFQI